MTPFDNMNKFDDLIEQAYALKYELEDNGEIMGALHMVTVIGFLCARQEKAIAAWQQSTGFRFSTTNHTEERQ